MNLFRTAKAALLTILLLLASGMVAVFAENVTTDLQVREPELRYKLKSYVAANLIQPWEVDGLMQQAISGEGYEIHTMEKGVIAPNWYRKASGKVVQHTNATVNGQRVYKTTTKVTYFQFKPVRPGAKARRFMTGCLNFYGSGPPEKPETPYCDVPVRWRAHKKVAGGPAKPSEFPWEFLWFDATTQEWKVEVAEIRPNEKGEVWAQPSQNVPFFALRWLREKPMPVGTPYKADLPDGFKFKPEKLERVQGKTTTRCNVVDVGTVTNTYCPPEAPCCKVPIDWEFLKLVHGGNARPSDFCFELHRFDATKGWVIEEPILVPDAKGIILLRDVHLRPKGRRWFVEKPDPRMPYVAEPRFGYFFELDDCREIKGQATTAERDVRRFVYTNTYVTQPQPQPTPVEVKQFFGNLGPLGYSLGNGYITNSYTPGPVSASLFAVPDRGSDTSSTTCKRCGKPDCEHRRPPTPPANNDIPAIGQPPGDSRNGQTPPPGLPPDY